jgi:MOSC domain-containing protein YiiM
LTASTAEPGSAPYWKLRRNLLTSDVDLAALVGRRFRIGDVEAEGLELCEPCATLGRLLSTQDVAPKRVIAELLHRAGLRARIVTSGVVRAGDSIGLSGWAA